MSKEITYSLDGQTVSSDEFYDRIAGGGRQREVQEAMAKIEGEVCEVHGQHAEVAEVDQTPNGFGFTISGCCDELIDRAYMSAATFSPADAIPTAR